MLFINDMPSVLSHSSTLALFADDAKCFRAIRSRTDFALLLDDIDKLVDRSDNWKLALNIHKWSLCKVTRKLNSIICTYKMGGKIPRESKRIQENPRGRQVARNDADIY